MRVEVPGLVIVDGVENWEQVKEVFEYANKRMATLSVIAAFASIPNSKNKPPADQTKNTPPWES